MAGDLETFECHRLFKFVWLLIVQNFNCHNFKPNSSTCNSPAVLQIFANFTSFSSLLKTRRLSAWNILRNLISPTPRTTQDPSYYQWIRAFQTFSEYLSFDFGGPCCNCSSFVTLRTEDWTSPKRRNTYHVHPGERFIFWLRVSKKLIYCWVNTVNSAAEV